uniref:Uncharacterized protein n=1 Tax=Ascaris lumbricoides TaxID=6252 RepID=A0A9J2Q415_ASCLU
MIVNIDNQLKFIGSQNVFACLQILNGISFSVNPGETVALVGTSGCGKSTVVSLLLRYYNPESGKILIDGHEISSLNLAYLRRMIGVVSQEPVLFNTTIKENIEMGNEDVTEGEIIAACRRANATNFINQLPNKYETIVGDRGTQLSGGQKQRIAIARALVRNPKILLLDEATSALDAESESIVQQALEKVISLANIVFIPAAEGRTTLVIAHRLSTIKNADKIIAMKDGRIIEIGTHNELIAANGFYRELVNAQVFADVDEKPAKEGHEIAYRSPSIISRRSRLSSTTSEKDAPLSPRFTSRTESKSGVDPSAQQDIKKETERLKKEMEEEGATESNLIEILQYARPEWIYIILALFACLIQGSVYPVFSLIFNEILAIFAKPRDQMLSNGHFYSLMFLVLGAVSAITLLIQAFFFGMSAERLTRRLRSRIFHNVLRMDIAYFDMPNHSSGKISTRLATDTPNVKSAIDYRLGSVLSSLVSVGFGVGIAFYFGWQMALLVIAIFPLAGVGQAFHLKYIEGRHNHDAKELASSGKVALEAIESIRTVHALTLERRFYEKFCHFLERPHKSSTRKAIAQVALEAIESIRTVHALTLERRFYEKFCHFLERPHKSSTRKAIAQGIAYGFANSIFYFLYASAFRFGLFLILETISSPINVMKVLFAISFTAGTLGFASAYFPEYAKAKFAAAIIFKMLKEEPKIDSMKTDGTKPEISGSVDFSKIYFAYPERPEVGVLKGLDLQVDAGQTLAIVGPSGCGKSTVVSLLERFYDPIDGTIKVDGNDIRLVNPSYLRSQLALVSQEPILFDCSIRENIVYGLQEDKFSEEDIVNVARLANIDKFIKELPDGYETRVGEKGTQLSGGQKQRIAIARALIRQPKILLLDEATSALDTESEKVVQEALDRAGKGRTCIIIAHRLSTVVNANCIAVVKNGIVLEKGTHAELMNKRGAYYSLTQKQSLKETGDDDKFDARL